MTIFAIDLGNKQTKMTDGQHTYIYPSSLLQARKVDSGFSLDDKMDNMEKFKSSAQNGAFYWGKGILKYGKMTYQRVCPLIDVMRTVFLYNYVSFP
ncbi:hypothetical protein [Ligilactobacillus salivarius]|uniref:hypothetical protein n=1 Tax=Ligilactobacillus salivarius TaxID=1624 RepID=UPI0024BB6130|nr:hypothetical protein [Ligilactobacillus salivarius]